MSETNLKAVEEVLPKLVSVVRQSAGLAGQDINFYKSLDKSILLKLDDASSRILDLIQRVVRTVDTGSDQPLEVSSETVEKSWKDIGDVLDGLFEKSDIAYDNYKKAGSQAAEQGPQLTYLEDSTRPSEKPLNRRLEKPQLKFKIPVDNTENHPFKPKITSKPNAIQNYTESVKLIEETEEIPSHYEHPYKIEIERQEYPDSVLAITEPELSQSWAETEAIWVDNVETLNKMVEELKKSQAIAVDLEHHDYRTYYGIVCLMQISNREQDWIVDTIALRDDLESLNVVFTDPNIVKVFHGAFMDIIWLQRDLGLYIVSLFDTYHASRLLGFPKHSLAYLLERFAHFKTSKKYQLADWRIRPLTEAMMSYARSDTHFLLNIYDQLRNQLIQSDKLKDVLHESRNVAKRRFEYTKYRPNIPMSSVVSPLNEKDEPWRVLMYQYNLPESKKSILVDLYNWRDKIARETDESVRYVMPNQLLVSLVADAPKDSAGVLATGNFVTDSVRVHSKAIAQIIQDAVKRSDDEDTLLMSRVHDAYEKLTPAETKVDDSFIEFLHSSFDSLLKKMGYLSQFDQSLIAKKSALLVEPENGERDVFSVEYKRNDPIRHMSQILLDRLRVVDENFLSQDEQAISLPTESPVPETSVDNKSEIVTAESEPAQEVKLDANEVITLRKRQNHTKNPKKRKAESEEPVEVFDYSSADKIMVEPSSRDRNKKQNKKKSFNPYAKDSEGPKLPKKVSRVNLGKSSSFKNRK